MKITPTRLPGVLLIEPKVFPDGRGHFYELWRKDRYEKEGIKENFVQDNVSFSKKGVVRGLHFQHPFDQAKLITPLEGDIFDVAVDVRPGSPTFGQHVAVTLQGGQGQQLFIPAGFAHGFCVLSETAAVIYRCGEYYAPGAERSVLWNDPAIAIPWPVDEPILSDKDRQAPLLADIDPDHLPTYQPE